MRDGCNPSQSPTRLTDRERPVRTSFAGTLAGPAERLPRPRVEPPACHGEASSGEKAVDKARTLEPEMIIMDLTMHG